MVSKPSNLNSKTRKEQKVWISQVLLAALYNASRPQGMGFIHYDPTPMTEAQAQSILDGGTTYFDYLKGRVMKISLAKDEVETWLYDRDNGSGAAENAVEALRSSGETNSSDIQGAHQAGKVAAIKDIEAHLDDEATKEVRGGIGTFGLGLKNVKQHLGPAVEKAKR